MTEPAPARGRSRSGRSPFPDATARGALAQRLSSQERLVVMLTYADRLSTREVAAVLGISAMRVQELRAGVVRRCREMLREQPAAS